MAIKIYPTNSDWDNFLSSTKSDTATKYHDAVCEYCVQNSYNHQIGQTVKDYLIFRHVTPRMCKRDNKRFEHVKGIYIVNKSLLLYIKNKTKLGQTFQQLTGELYSCLSAIKKYFVCFDLSDPCVQNPTIKTNLSMWMKEDPKSLQAAVFEEEELEEFIAYADNTPEHLVAKASALLYLSCVGRQGELTTAEWKDMSQITIEGKLVWQIAYIREKQGNTPEESKSILGDEISNLAFSLYAGIY